MTKPISRVRKLRLRHEVIRALQLPPLAGRPGSNPSECSFCASICPTDP
jgi:hypothetical protein